MIARHKAEALLSELQSHLIEDDIKSVVNKAKRSQLSNRYIGSNFRIDTGLVDLLLDLTNQAVAIDKSPT